MLEQQVSLNVLSINDAWYTVVETVLMNFKILIFFFYSREA